MNEIPEERLAVNASNALKELLSDKHLYQRTAVDLGCLDEISREVDELNRKAAAEEPGSHYVPPTLEECRSNLHEIINNKWRLALRKSGGHPWFGKTFGANEPLEVVMPTIKSVCSNANCGVQSPFNPVNGSVSETDGAAQEQCFYLEYECQSCKGPTLHFLVKKSKERLMLCGRSPMEVVNVSSVIPKKHAGYFRDAVIAHNSGQTLAGLFLLRVFVEQFWKSIPEVAGAVSMNLRPSGDQLGEAYKGILPADFKARFPSLSEIYEDLSNALHSAKADADLFQQSHAQIVKHFDARRLFGM